VRRRASLAVVTPSAGGWRFRLLPREAEGRVLLSPQRAARVFCWGSRLGEGETWMVDSAEGHGLRWLFLFPPLATPKASCWGRSGGAGEGVASTNRACTWLSFVTYRYAPVSVPGGVIRCTHGDDRPDRDTTGRDRNDDRPVACHPGRPAGRGRPAPDPTHRRLPHPGRVDLFPPGRGTRNRQAAGTDGSLRCWRGCG
jgi:hypothetical protein